VVVPVRVPSKITEAPGRAAPFPSFTTPLIVAVGVWAVAGWKNKKLVKMMMIMRIVVEEFLIIADSLIRLVTFFAARTGVVEDTIFINVLLELL
jgi:hypothetical protein